MDLRELVGSVLAYDALAARQWVADADAVGISWSTVGRPAGLSALELAVAAGIVELMALRTGVASPAWTSEVSASPQRRFLVRAAETMPRLRRLCETEGPEPLRRRGLYAPPEFLSVA